MTPLGMDDIDATIECAVRSIRQAIDQARAQALDDAEQAVLRASAPGDEQANAMAAAIRALERKR